MRKRGLAVLLGTVGIATSAAGVTACTSILGDYSLGTTAGDDGGPTVDGVAPTTDGTTPPADGTSGNDGAATPDGSTGPDGTSPSDGGGTDADDGGSPPALKCTEPNGVVHMKLGTIVRSSNNDNNAVNLFYTGTPNHTVYRAVVPEQPSNGPSIAHVYTFDNGSNVTDTQVPGNSGNILRVRRYAGGLAALVEENLNDAGTSTQQLSVYTLDDSASAWSAPTVLLTNGILQQCTNRFEGDLVVLNAAQGDFLAELEFQTCANPPATVHAATRTGAPMPAMWPLPPQNQEADAGDSGPPPQGFDIGALIAPAPPSTRSPTRPGTAGPRLASAARSSRPPPPRSTRFRRASSRS